MYRPTSLQLLPLANSTSVRRLAEMLPLMAPPGGQFLYSCPPGQLRRHISCFVHLRRRLRSEYCFSLANKYGYNTILAK